MGGGDNGLCSFQRFDKYLMTQMKLDGLARFRQSFSQLSLVNLQELSQHHNDR